MVKPIVSALYGPEYRAVRTDERQVTSKCWDGCMDVTRMDEIKNENVRESFKVALVSEKMNSKKLM